MRKKIKKKNLVVINLLNIQLKIVLGWITFMEDNIFFERISIDLA